MELATTCRVAPATGEHRLHHARCLTERLPRTLEQLRAGRIAHTLAADPDATWQRLLTDPLTGTARHLDVTELPGVQRDESRPLTRC